MEFCRIKAYKKYLIDNEFKVLNDPPETIFKKAFNILAAIL